MIKGSEYFDVLSLESKANFAEMIHSFFADECLGSQVEGGITKLYFSGGDRKIIESKLSKLPQILKAQWQWDVLAKKDWHLKWQKNFQPVFIDDKIAIIPSWKKSAKAEIIVKIKPGMAFGTGHHESTCLMLHLMSKCLRPGMSMLDLGTGSGILAITANKLGAVHIDAVEFDSDCRENFLENLKLNNMTGAIPLHIENILNWEKYKYDLITANINRNVFQNLLPLLSGSPALMLISGILDKDFPKISQLCSENNLYVQNKKVKGEWIALEIKSK